MTFIDLANPLYLEILYLHHQEILPPYFCSEYWEDTKSCLCHSSYSGWSRDTWGDNLPSCTSTSPRLCWFGRRGLWWTRSAHCGLHSPTDSPTSPSACTPSSRQYRVSSPFPHYPQWSSPELVCLACSLDKEWGKCLGSGDKSPQKTIGGAQHTFMHFHNSVYSTYFSVFRDFYHFFTNKISK